VTIRKRIGAAQGGMTLMVIRIIVLSNGEIAIMLCEMENLPLVTEIVINIRTLAHKGTGALMAVSDDLAGFYVAGRTHNEIEAKIEAAIRDHYALMGSEVISVTVSSEDGDVAGFESTLPAFIAHASLGEKHAV
jgi:hypothetical protein